jgi:hypothetical protein
LKRRRQQSAKLRAVEAVLKESEMQLSIITPKICWGSESEMKRRLISARAPAKGKFSKPRRHHKGATCDTLL